MFLKSLHSPLSMPVLDLTLTIPLFTLTGKGFKPLLLLLSLLISPKIILLVLPILVLITKGRALPLLSETTIPITRIETGHKRINLFWSSVSAPKAHIIRWRCSTLASVLKVEFQFSSCLRVMLLVFVCERGDCVGEQVSCSESRFPVPRCRHSFCL